MKKIVSTLLLIILWSTQAVGQLSKLEARADSLFDIGEEKKALTLYNKILKKNPKNFTALWRSSLLYARIGHRLEDEKQADYYKKAKKRAQRALEVKPRNTHANYAMAVALGRMAQIAGAQERVAASRKIKKYARLAIKYDSTNADAWYLLGRWHYEVDNLSFAEQLAANLLFGGLPDASTKKAAKYIEKAIKLNPNDILYYYDLARAYAELGRTSAAIGVCRKALNMPTRSPSDPITKDKCRELIDDLK